MEQTPKYIPGLTETKGEHVTRALKNVFEKLRQLEREKAEAKCAADLIHSRKDANAQSVREAQATHATAEARCKLLELQLRHIRTLLEKSVGGVIWDDVQTETKMISTAADTYQTKTQIRKTVSKTCQGGDQYVKNGDTFSKRMNLEKFPETVALANSHQFHDVERERHNHSSENSILVHSSEDIHLSSSPQCHPSAPPMPDDVGVTTLPLDVSTLNNSEQQCSSLGGMQFIPPFLQPAEYTSHNGYSNIVTNSATDNAGCLLPDHSQYCSSFVPGIASKGLFSQSGTVGNGIPISSAEQSHNITDDAKNPYLNRNATSEFNQPMPVPTGAFKYTTKNLEEKLYSMPTCKDSMQQSSRIPETVTSLSNTISENPFFYRAAYKNSGLYGTGIMAGQPVGTQPAERDTNVVPITSSISKKQTAGHSVQNMKSLNSHSYLKKESLTSQQLSSEVSRIKNTSQEKEKSRTPHDCSELQIAETSPMMMSNLRSTNEVTSNKSLPDTSHPILESTPCFSNISGNTLEVPSSSKCIQDNGIAYVTQRDGTIYHTKKEVVRLCEHKQKQPGEDHLTSAESQNQRDNHQTTRKFIEDGGSRFTPRKNIGSGTSPKNRNVSKTTTPFILGKSTGDSYSIPANIQNVRNILKNGSGKLRSSLNDYNGTTNQEKPAALCNINGTAVMYSSDLNSTKKDLKEIICQLEEEKSIIIQELHRCEKLLSGAAHPSLAESMVPERDKLRQRLNEKIVQINTLNTLLDVIYPSNHQQFHSQRATLSKNKPGHLFVTTEITTRPDSKFIGVQTTMAKAAKTLEEMKNSEISSNRQFLHELRNIKHSLQEN